MKEQRFHDKIVYTTFFYSLLVVWVHSYNAVLYLGNHRVAYKIERIERVLGDTVAQIAVPGFFMISSYLFFRNYIPAKLKSKWLSRVRSILVPYIVWNVIYYLGYVIGSRLPGITEIIGKGTVPFDLFTVVDAILHYTYNYVFWYLYQLILLIILAPVLYQLMKRIWLGIIWLCVLLGAVYLGGSLPVINLDAMFYYSLAGFAAIHGKILVEGNVDKKRCLIGGSLIAAAILLRRMGLPGESRGELVFTIVAFRAAVPAGLWLMVPAERLPEPREWMKNNFFLYAVHFALVRLINKSGAWILPGIPAVPLILYIVMPVLALVISNVLGKMLRRYMPHTWYLLNGGRSRQGGGSV